MEEMENYRRAVLRVSAGDRRKARWRKECAKRPACQRHAGHEGAQGIARINRNKRRARQPSAAPMVAAERGNRFGRKNPH